MPPHFNLHQSYFRHHLFYFLIFTFATFGDSAKSMWRYRLVL